jgi:uncharacterized protein with HEPN domain
MKPFFSDKDRANLLAMLDAIGKIQRFTKDLNTPDDFINDEETFDATLMNFVIIGESVARLSESLKGYYSGIVWQKIKGFRNIVVHDYFGVDAAEVWQIIQKFLPVLKKELEEIISRESH